MSPGGQGNPIGAPADAPAGTPAGKDPMEIDRYGFFFQVTPSFFRFSTAPERNFHRFVKVSFILFTSD